MACMGLSLSRTRTSSSRILSLEILASWSASFAMAAAVFASNYLVTLLDLAQQSYVAAGIAPELALKLMEPLVREELEAKKTPPVAAAHVEATPAKPKTSAPPPPAEVGGRASAPGDVMVAAAAANDFRAFKAELNRRELAKLKAG